MSVSIENTSGIPAAVWVIGLLILAAVILYAVKHGHNVKIGPIEFESKGEQAKKQPPSEESAPSDPGPAEGKHIDPTAEPLTEGVAHLFGTTRTQDSELAYLYLTKAAEAGQREAFFYLGYMYAKGLYVRLDYQEAMAQYKKGADRGSTSAMNNIGHLYENGLGVAQDYKAAADWYIRAADLGDPAGQGNAARMYKNGRGVPQDLDKAITLYRRAIQQGNESAMNNLAVMYEEGVGVQQDITQAIFWYKEAAKNGNKSAPKALERLKESRPELFT
ncbi:MAG: sel1 repeat family protein [Clostridia bacterium]|nr:sel1 repeat family protein [Clostridia bacterium]